MTETITTASPPKAAIGRRIPPNTLLNLIISVLASMFLSVTNGDIYFARLAAIEIVNAYRARNHADLIAIPRSSPAASRPWALSACRWETPSTYP